MQKTIKLNIGCGSNTHADWLNADLFRSKNVKKVNIKKPLPFKSNSVDIIYHSHLLEHIEKTKAKKFIKECYRILRPGGMMRVVVPDLEKICREYIKNIDSAKTINDPKVILDYEWNKVQLLDQLVRTKPGGEMAKIVSNNPRNKEYINNLCGNIFFTENSRGNKLKKAIKLMIGLQFKQIVHHLKRKMVKDEANLVGDKHYWMYDELDLKILLKESGFEEFSVKKYNESNILNWNNYLLDSLLDGKCCKPDSLFVEVKKNDN